MTAAPIAASVKSTNPTSTMSRLPFSSPVTAPATAAGVDGSADLRTAGTRSAGRGVAFGWETFFAAGFAFAGAPYAGDVATRSSCCAVAVSTCASFFFAFADSFALPERDSPAALGPEADGTLSTYWATPELPGSGFGGGFFETSAWPAAGAASATIATTMAHDLTWPTFDTP